MMPNIMQSGLFLVLRKWPKHYHTVCPCGAQAVLDVPLYGRVSSINLLRPTVSMTCQACICCLERTALPAGMTCLSAQHGSNHSPSMRWLLVSSCCCVHALFGVLSRAQNRTSCLCCLSATSSASWSMTQRLVSLTHAPPQGGGCQYGCQGQEAHAFALTTTKCTGLDTHLPA